jgi:hypothetical protein
MTTTVPILATAPETEYSVEFLQGMVNRMGVSYYKYGLVADAVGHIDFLANIQRRVDEYVRTGNTEFLMDAGNFAMMEFMHPSVAGAHYRPTDSDEAPPRSTTDGGATIASNAALILDANFRKGNQ